MQAYNPTSSLDRMTPRDLIRLHIRDKYHVVTDEEITGLAIGSEAFEESVTVMEQIFLERELSMAHMEDSQ